MITEAKSPAGDPAWLVDDYVTVKALLADNRLSRFSHPDPANAPRFTGSEIVGAPLHDQSLDDLREEAIHEFIAPFVKPTRITDLRTIVHRQTERHVADVRNRRIPFDIIATLAYPIPASVISTIIGFPESVHEQVCELARTAGNIRDRDASESASDQLCDLTLSIINEGGVPSEDHIIRRINMALATERFAEFRPEQFAEMIKGVQIAGQMNAASSIERGLLHICRYEQESSLKGWNSEDFDRLVDEVMRIAHPMNRKISGIPRFALEDVQVGATLIRKGSLVILDPEAANHDTAVFRQPDEFDPKRSPNPHLAFGYGRHFCVGAALAKLEVKTVLQYILSEFPGLRLPSQDFEPCDDQLVGGLKRLFVEWDY